MANPVPAFVPPQAGPQALPPPPSSGPVSIVPSAALGTPPVDGDPTLRRFGGLLTGGGAVALVAASIFAKADAAGSIVSACLFAVIVGLVLLNPTMLQDGTKTDAGEPAVSSMRVAILLVVSTFTLVTVKAGWAAAGVADLKLDPSWAWVLAAALGGKAAQSFAEISSKGPGR
jgi:hypothetical protein